MSRNRVERRVGIAIAAVLVILGGGIAIRSSTMEKRVEFRLELYPPGGPPDRTIRKVNGRLVTLPADGWSLWVDDRRHESFPVILTLDDMREVAPLPEGRRVPRTGKCEEVLRTSFGFTGELVDHDGRWLNFDPNAHRVHLCWAHRVEWRHADGRYDALLLYLVGHPGNETARAAVVRLAREEQLVVTGWSCAAQTDDDSLRDGILTGVRRFRRTGKQVLSASGLVLSAAGMPTGDDRRRVAGASGWYLDDR